jgi:PAS domain S-box-containing protein
MGAAIFSIVSIACCFILIILAANVLNLDRKNETNIIFHGFAMFSAVLAFFEFMLKQSETPDRARIWVYLLATWPVVTVMGLHLVLSFTGYSKKLNRPLMLFALYAPYAAYIYGLAASRYFIQVIENMPWGFSAVRYAEKSWYIAMLYTWVTIITLLSITCIFLYIKNAKSSASKQQGKMILIALIIPSAIGYLESIVTAVTGIKLPGLTTVGVLFMAAFIALAVSKYRLFRVKAETAAESILSTMIGYIVLLNEDLDIIRANKSVCKELGYREYELIGRNAEVLYSGSAPDIRNCVIDEEDNCMLRKVEAQLKTKSGAEVPVIMSISAVVDGFGAIHGYVMTAVSIEERKKLEQELIVEIQKTEMMNLEIKENFEKLKEVDRLKQNFIAIVSHELRTPLTSIKGFLSFLIKGVTGPINPQQAEFLGYIGNNTERLLQLINELLDFSKIESGTFSVKKSRGDVILLAKKAIVEMLSIANKKSIFLMEHFKEQSIIADIDDSRIYQVIINLLNNSIKFSPPASAIHIGADAALLDSIQTPAYVNRSAMKAEKYIKFYVVDEGAGMEPQYAEKVFERFYQIESADTRRHEGVGLGLNIAKNIIEAHNGAIWAESQGKGKGSSFYFIIPL